MTTHVALLAAALASREVWHEFEASGEAAEVPEDLAPFVDYTRDYYAADAKAQAVDFALLQASIVDTVRDPKRREVMMGTLDVLKNIETSLPNARRAVRMVRSRRVSELLATKLLLPPKDGEERHANEIIPLIDEYVELQGSAEHDDAPTWTKEVIAPIMGSPRIPVYPKALGARLRGGLWPGHHMTIFGRPEVGKTALAMTIAVRAAANGKARVLYLSNEDTVRDLMMRALAQFGRCGTDAVLAHLEAVLVQARKFGADRLLFRDMAPGNLPEIERLVRKNKPDLFIVDQMRNVGAGKNAENMTQRLDAVSQGIRNIAKRNNCAAISLTQAGDSARDKPNLDDGDVDYSNTGISAGCDVLVGIGANEIMRQAGERRLSIIKNKLGGTHGTVDVRFDPATLTYKD